MQWGTNQGWQSMASIWNRPLIRLSLGAALVCAASAVGAVPVISQEQKLFDPNVAIASFVNEPAQSFHQTTGNNIRGAGILLFDNGQTGNVTISLWADALPGKGTLLRTGTVSDARAGFYVDVLWDPVDSKSDTLYF